MNETARKQLDAFEEAVQWCYDNDITLAFKGTAYQHPGISVVWRGEGVGWGDTIRDAVWHAKSLVEQRKRQTKSVFVNVDANTDPVEIIQRVLEQIKDIIE